MKVFARRWLLAVALFGIVFAAVRFSPKAKSPALPTDSGSVGGPAFTADSLRAPEGAAPARTEGATGSAKAGAPGATTASTADAAWAALPEPERRQARTLERVLASRDDNAPELDRELRELSPAMRAYLRGRYAGLPRERRNDQGTIVFLIGRAPRDEADFEFLRRVVSEPPCLSLADCGRAGDGLAESHHSSVDGVTLAYPQLVALNRVETLLAEGRLGDRERAWAVLVIDTARGSKDPRVAEKARELAARYRPGN